MKFKIAGVKRLIGCKSEDTIVQSDMEYWPFEVISDGGKPKIQVTEHGEKKEFFPEEISSMILAKMKETAEAYLGQTVTDAVIAVPAHFNTAQREAMKDAGATAGLNVLSIINEPTAAAIAYGFDKFEDKRERKALIFDLGAGSCNVSIVSIRNGLFEVKSTAGDNSVGGEEFNTLMSNYFLGEFYKDFENYQPSNKRTLWRIRDACEEAKITLSSYTRASVQIDSLFHGFDLKSSITRGVFEALIAHLFHATIQMVVKVIGLLHHRFCYAKTEQFAFITFYSVSELPS